ncbi:GRAS domain-containing protein [Cephalotus follicularis]|uniref:GRAS domain-containing protein n=1 Tax=Cephalotus follicularis TaxID=3775 RepID=A0A1Q3DAS9_CEPFO|nr:GRAS domain-containing protein [Cephalotus follicularis]
MRVPVTQPQQNNQSPDPKPIICTTNNNHNRNIGFPLTNNNGSNSNTPNSCYEPTSVLDLRSSPGPAPEKPAQATDVSALADPIPVEWEEHVLRNMDWDSIMRDLGLDDDSAPASKLIPQFTPCGDHLPLTAAAITHLPELLATHHQFDPTQLVHNSDFTLSEIYPNLHQTHNNNNNNSTNSFGIGNHHHHHHHNSNSNSNAAFYFIEDLIRAADCFDSNELQLAHVILARLNQRLRSPAGKPLERAAFYFKEALQSLLPGSTRTSGLSSWSDIVHSIRAHKAFSGISPIPMFTHFTSNQALLESLEGSPPPLIHIIDFDIGLGGQYASFMREIAEKSVTIKLNPPAVRITAIVSEEYAIETRLIKDNLTQFARELNIRFQVEFVLMRTFETLSFKAIKPMDGEKVAVILSPVMLRRYGSTNDVSRFLNDLRRVSPRVVVFVDSEGWTENGSSNGGAATTASFRRNFVSCLEFYATMFESLDAAAAVGGEEWVRKIEMSLLRPRIAGAVQGAAARRTVAAPPPWREAFLRAGLRPVQLSKFADFQAECLLRKVQIRGFHVARRHAELVLCWNERPLVATSAWRC